jgi:putative ABC transport system permease protein
VTAKLVFENLKNKPMRSLLSVLLIGVPVTLILTLVGLSHGMIEDTQKRTRGIGADIIVRPPGSSLLQLNGAIRDGFVDYLQKQPHVKLALGVVNQPIESVFLGATGIDLDKFKQMNGGFTFISGGRFQNPDDVIVDEYYAAERKISVGDHIQLLGHKWRVCGIIAGGKLARIVLPLKILQDLTSKNGYVSQIYVQLDNPANSETVLKELQTTPALTGYGIFSMEAYLSAFTVDAMPGLRPFITVIMAIGVVIGFAVVCLSMYMAVLQRTREIGILKALGASNGFILRSIVAEAMLMGVGGTILGIVMSYGAYWLIHALVPASIQMVIVKGWWPIALIVTLIGTGLGALYPGLSAARHDPIEALAYE